LISPTNLKMQLLKKQSLGIAALGVGMLSAPAAQAANASACARLDAVFQAHNRTGAAFTWNTNAKEGIAPPVVARKIAIWGDSLTSARDFIDAALDTAGIPKETALPSFIQAGIPVAGLRLPLKTACAGNGWKQAYAHKEKRSQPGFSKGLLSMSSENPGDTISLDFRSPSPSTRVKALTLLYEKPGPDASLLLGVAVDGGEETFISLSRRSGSTLQIRPDAPMATIRFRLVSGKLAVHGFAPVYQDAPATVLDTFSVPGGLLRSWSNTAERHFSAAPELAADYSLILVQYGTNEGASPSFSRERYSAYLRENLARMRGFYPRARCILIGPPDRGVVGSIGPPDIFKYSNVHSRIAAAQKQAALEHRCEFWDWQAAMGGPGSAARWARMQAPQMQPDLIHLTAKGYQVSGRMFAQSMLLNKN
jgi:lysophospholipase L1-like esterase